MASRLSNKDLKYVYYNLYCFIHNDMHDISPDNLFYFPPFHAKFIFNVENDTYDRLVYECIRQYYKHNSSINTHQIPAFENKHEWKEFFFLYMAHSRTSMPNSELQMLEGDRAEIVTDLPVAEIVHAPLMDSRHIYMDKIVNGCLSIQIDKNNMIAVNQVLSKLQLTCDDEFSDDIDINVNIDKFESAVYDWYCVLVEGGTHWMNYRGREMIRKERIIYILLNEFLILLMKKYCQDKAVASKIFGSNLRKFPFVLLKILQHCETRYNELCLQFKTSTSDSNYNSNERKKYYRIINRKYDFNHHFCQIMVYIRQLMIAVESLIPCNHGQNDRRNIYGSTNIDDFYNNVIVNGQIKSSVPTPWVMSAMGCNPFKIDMKKYYLIKMIKEKKIGEIARYIECQLFSIAYLEDIGKYARDIEKMDLILSIIEIVVKYVEILLFDSKPLMKQIFILIKNIKKYYVDIINSGTIEYDWSRPKMVESMTEEFREKDRKLCYPAGRELIVLHCQALLCRIKFYYTIGWFKFTGKGKKRQDDKERLQSRIKQLCLGYSMFANNFTRLCITKNSQYLDYCHNAYYANLLPTVWMNDWIEDSLWIKYIDHNTFSSPSEIDHDKLVEIFPFVDKKIKDIRKGKHKAFLRRVKYFLRYKKINNPKKKSNYNSDMNQDETIEMRTLLHNGGLNTGKCGNDARYPYILYNMSKLRECDCCQHKHTKLKTIRPRKNGQMKYYFCNRACLKRWHMLKKSTSE